MLVQRFRAKLRQDIDTRIGDHCEDMGVDVEDLTLEDFFQIVQRMEKRCARDKQRQGLISTPLVAKGEQGRVGKCHYCGKEGHLIKHCNVKRRGQRPCQAHIDWGKKVFGEDFKWDYKKPNTAVKQTTAVMAVDVKETATTREEAIRELEGKLASITEEVAVVAVSQAKAKLGERSVALFKADFKNGEGGWMYSIHGYTIADSGGFVCK